MVRTGPRGRKRGNARSRATLHNIRQNRFEAVVCNSLGIPLAAGLLYACTGLLLSAVITTVAMGMRSVTALNNALWLHQVRLKG